MGKRIVVVQRGAGAARPASSRPANAQAQTTQGAGGQPTGFQSPSPNSPQRLEQPPQAAARSEAQPLTASPAASPPRLIAPAACQLIEAVGTSSHSASPSDDSHAGASAAPSSQPEAHVLQFSTADAASTSSNAADPTGAAASAAFTAESANAAAARSRGKEPFRQPQASTSRARSPLCPPKPAVHHVEGYNSADEHDERGQDGGGRGLAAAGDGWDAAEELCRGYTLAEQRLRERQFEVELAREKFFKISRMRSDGNCLFRAVSHQVYGDPELCSSTRQMCVDYMEGERDYFSQFVTEDFSLYLARKRRDKCYGNNLEMQAMAEMYNRPIEVYCYSAQPINIFHSGYSTENPAIRLSYHRGNHYNSILDMRRSTVGAGLGLPGVKVGDADTKHKLQAAIKQSEDAIVERALLAEGRALSDADETQRALEDAVMKASRLEVSQPRSAEVTAAGPSGSLLSAAPTSSPPRGGAPPDDGMSPTRIAAKMAKGKTRCAATDPEHHTPSSTSSGAHHGGHGHSAHSPNLQTLLGMGFGYDSCLEAQSIFNDDLDNMICYLLDGGTASSMDAHRSSGTVDKRDKGKHVAP